jgi:rhomboid protease GluP
MNEYPPYSNPNPAGDEHPVSRPLQPGERQPAQVSLRLPKIKPWVSYTMIGLCVFVYLLQVLSQSYLGDDYLVLYGAKINQYILAGEFWRFITPMFLHASIIHIAFNMYALFILGPGLERFYGHSRFLALYLLGGFAGNVLSFVFSTDASIGASTAIFALVAAQGIFILKNRFLFGKNARSLLINTMGIVIINFVFGLAAQASIDNFGHLGGLLGGLAFAWFASPVFKVNGLMPDLYLEDQRTTSQVVISGLVVTLIFSILAAIRFIFIRG